MRKTLKLIVDFDPNCKDEVDNCNQYNTGFCTDGAYVNWAKAHCKKYCGYCGGSVTTTKAPAVSGDCLDTDNCAGYGQNVCTEYASWAKTHCKKFCKLCELSEKPARRTSNVCQDSADCDAYGSSVCERKDFARKHCRRYCGLCQGCEDQESNCAAYGSSICTEYKPWATAHCQGFCGLCNKRRKRETGESGPPPMIKGVGLKPIAREEEMLTDELLAVESDGMYDDGDVISGTNEEQNRIPTQPICGTVRTEANGRVNILGKLLPGVLCEQVIALPLDSRVLLHMTDFDIDCDIGDELSVIDVVGNKEIKICNSLERNDWLSSGNIVAVKFRPAVNGHGIAYTYEAFPQNKTIPACNQYFTSAVGEVTSITYPDGAKHADDSCEIFIVGTPGKSIEMTFNTFRMETDGNESCLHIKDTNAEEEDIFCGELSPFIWESRGSNIRLTYEKLSRSGEFSATYTVKDI